MQLRQTKGKIGFGTCNIPKPGSVLDQSTGSGVDQPKPDHGHIRQLVQRLINARRAPVGRISRRELLIRRVTSLPPIDVVMNYQFGNNERQDEREWRANNDENNDRAHRMDTGMQETSEMNVLIPAVQHDLGLQEIVCKHVLDLQQA